MTERSGFDLIPTGAKVLAAFVFLVIAFLFFWLFDEHKTIGWGTAMGAGFGTLAAAFILLTGYVYADSSRRGMPSMPWMALVLLIPNALGFVLYFLLRKPILHPCSHCGGGVAQDAAYCSRCGQSQSSAGVPGAVQES